MGSRCSGLWWASRMWAGLLVAQAVLAGAGAVAQDAAAAAAAGAEVQEDPLTELADRVRRSLVVVRAATRDGSDEGLGSGFAIGDAGLIVTARHVIGDGRDIVVELSEGRSVKATEVYATSSQLDLAVIRIPDTSLPALELGTADQITQGRRVIAMGHPRGFRNSVVDGVISGQQEIDGVTMIQLAMPVEPGNSGGPVVDRQGRVLGIVTMKSTASDNLGFALPVNLLHDMLRDPNPVPIEHWRTIGALDPRWWIPVFGGNWRQRAGRITVNGTGDAFGGRTLCLSTRPASERPFEVQVLVRLKDESGAAGLIFHADGGDRHYGFYPSAGNLRLTRFDGPDVDSWTILHNAPHPAWRSGGWNTLRVTLLEDRCICYVNGQKVLESTDSVLPPGQVGLAAFRGTEAEFRGFACGRELPSNTPDEATQAALQAAIAKLQPDAPASEDIIQSLLPHAQYTTEYFQQEADRLEALARQLRQAADSVHEARIRRQLVELLRSDPAPGTDSQVLHAALLIAQLDNPDVDVAAYLERVDQMASEIRQSLTESASPDERLQALDRYLFEQNGFRGSRFEYYTRSNSYVNEVLDDREGLPITLSVVYMALAGKLGLNVVGVGLPGHFVVRYEPLDEQAAGQLIDPFERGRRLSVADAAARVRDAGFPDEPRFYAAQSAAQIAQRILLNLLNLAEASRVDQDVLRYLETLVALAPDEPEYRAKRLEMRARTGRTALAIEDVNWFIEHQPEGTDRERVLQLRAVLQQQLDQARSAEVSEE